MKVDLCNHKVGYVKESGDPLERQAETVQIDEL